MNPPQVNPDAACDFLAHHSQNGCFLTAIHPDKKGTETRSFGPSEMDAAAAWIAKNNATKNIYFSVNSTRRRMSKRAKKSDIQSLDYVHVDIDPRPGFDLIEEHARSLKALMESPLKPSIIIDSGGGYQGFWKLKESVPVNGDPEGLEIYSKAVEKYLGGDSCHNIDRIMRVPGIVNHPNKKKREAGRIFSQASLVYFGDEVYNPEDFAIFGPVEPKKEKKSAKTESTKTDFKNKALPQRFLEEIQTDRKLRAGWQGVDDGLKNPTRNEKDMRMVGLLKWRGYSLAEVKIILWHFPHGKARERKDDYIQHMWDLPAAKKRS